VGGATTVRLAVAVRPGPLSVAVTAPVVFTFNPGVVPVTATLTVQLPLAARPAPASERLVAPAAGANVPPHVFVTAGVAPTCIPAGKPSVIERPVRAIVFGFVKPIVRVDVPPTGICAGENDFVTTGGEATVRLAEAVFPVPPFADVTASVTLFFTPLVVPRTETLTEQDEFTATEPPESVMLVAPATGVNVPPQVFVAPGVGSTSRPAGKGSTTPTPVSATVLTPGFVIVSVRVVVPFSAIVVGANAFAIVGGATTVNVAEAVSPVPPSLELMAPVVLFFVPAVVPVTATVTVQLLPGVAIAPLVKETVVAPAAGANVPPQLFVAAGVAATCIPAGNVSETAMFVSPTVFPAGFVIVSVRVDVPFSEI
jgi:hypothetical protein